MKINRTIAIIVIVVALIAVVTAAYEINRLETKTSTKTTVAPAVLNILYANAPYMDPAVGSDDASSSTYPNLYDTLIYIELNGTIIPDLATSWNYSSDGLTWTFNLRQGVTFHDGSNLTANDVKFSMDRMLAIGEGYSYLYADYVNSTTVVNNYTVQFNMLRPYGPFLSSLIRLYILNENLVMAHVASGTYGNGTLGDYGMGWLNAGNDAGSGPYYVANYVTGTSMTMDRFTNYWGDYAPNAPSQVNVGFTPDFTRTVAQVAERDLDITDITEPTENIEMMNTTSGVSIATFYHTWVFYFALNTQVAPLDDIYVRTAMAYAFDYQTWDSSIMPGSVQAVGPVLNGLPGWDPNLPQYNLNLTMARQELALSKYADNISSYTITLEVTSALPSEEPGATLFASDMAQIGINIKVEIEPWLSFLANAASLSSAPDIALFSTGADYPDAISTLIARYSSSADGSWEQNEWLNNSTLDAQMEAAAGTMSEAQRFQDEYAIQQYIVNLCPTIFVCDWTQMRAYQSAYVVWPAAAAHGSYVPGYDLDCRYISVYPQNRTAELNGGS